MLNIEIANRLNIHSRLRYEIITEQVDLNDVQITFRLQV